MQNWSAEPCRGQEMRRTRPLAGHDANHSGCDHAMNLDRTAASTQQETRWKNSLYFVIVNINGYFTNFYLNDTDINLNSGAWVHQPPNSLSAMSTSSGFTHAAMAWTGTGSPARLDHPLTCRRT